VRVRRLGPISTIADRQQLTVERARTFELGCIRSAIRREPAMATTATSGIEVVAGRG